MDLIPATILTGFLGSGKSTLLRRVLTEAHGHKIAVIENEFGEENIDGELIVSGGSEQVLVMRNGCVCCSIREDLRATLWDLCQRRRAGDLHFDRVMIETTGLADPGPVVQTFFLDDRIASRYRPDGVLTLVDALHAMDQLNARMEARRQVGFADRIFLSKTDLATEAQLRVLCDRLRSMNPRAPQVVARYGNVELEQVLDVGGFNLNPELHLDLDLLAKPPCEARHHVHQDDVRSFVFRSERPLHGPRFGQFVNAIVNSYGPRLLRYKGILNLSGNPRKVVLQGVHQLMSHEIGPPWAEGEPRVSKLVFIGIELPGELITRSLGQCVV